MSDFAPSPEAARVALGADTPIITRPHPSGAKGAHISLVEVSARILKGRLDPRVRAWAIAQLQKANRPRSHQGRAQAILEGLRKKALYIPDAVNAEFIQAAHLTLCLDDKSLCFAGGDCDDLCVAYGSAVMSIGIPVQVVGQAFDGTNTPTHVIVAVQVESGDWLRVDPSSEKWPVGQCTPATGEYWIDPFEDKDTGLAGPATGDYVGVGTPVDYAFYPRFARHWYPNPAGGWHYVDRPALEDTQVGVGQSVVHSAISNVATWVNYGAIGAAVGVAGYVLYQVAKK
jgi:hypothetical protein